MAETCFVWVYLPGASDPVVAGRVDRLSRTVSEMDDTYVFTYGRSYLDRRDALPLFSDLPLQRGVQEPAPGLQIAGTLLDATPDSWGRRVIHEKLTGPRDRTSDPVEFDLLTYMLESGSDRFGALDFQISPTDYVARGRENASLSQLLDVAEIIESGEPLPAGVDDALALGTTAGGARPKALVQHEGRSYIAKFPSSTDTFSVVKAEALAMELARRVGITVAPTEVLRVAGRDVLLVERFDRSQDGSRRMAVSALTLFKVRPELSRGKTSYPEFADIVRSRFVNPGETRIELFRRMVFNVVIRNTDDHARNHAAFWDGKYLDLTPAYDISPTMAARPDSDASHPMALTRTGEHLSRLSSCVESAGVFGLTKNEATELIDEQLAIVRDQWTEVADSIGMAQSQKRYMWQRQILNEAIFWGWRE